MAFTRMDQSTKEDWDFLCQQAVIRQSEMPARVMNMLTQLKGITDGHSVDHFEHALQTATRAVRDQASEELTIAALCHDIADSINNANHAAIAAEILKPYVTKSTYAIVLHHDIFQGRYHYTFFGKNPEARQKFAAEPWFAQASIFSDQWDQLSFDPEYDSLPFDYFLPLIERIFKNPRPEFWQADDRLTKQPSQKTCTVASFR